ncbi:hypothetical protein GXM_04605 [Nostoc sphaeroides CCNUC1]|uniref:Uncharacterized protein n=1 Tax=Nostoc sphaeroides CCNUC1 TaxID=2653204 RepID=A0A5P8W3E9_9NOSO|nr:hypothetical protein GXM_04605 [Nostoc sphaeroides CCNUC1]
MLVFSSHQETNNSNAFIGIFSGFSGRHWVLGLATGST